MTLRDMVVAILGVGVVLSIVVGVTHFPFPAFMLTGYWLLAIVAILIERGRYRPRVSGTNFKPTSERYADPVSGVTTTVYVDEATGQRDYRPEASGR